MHRNVSLAFHVLPLHRAMRVLINDSDLGDPMDDLSVATVLMMVGGQLVLLRPRKVCFITFYY